MVALNPEGPAVCIYHDTKRTIIEIEKLSKPDALSYPKFERSFARIGKVLAPLIAKTPPAIEKPTAVNCFTLGKLARSFRKLGKQDAYRLLRWGPMAVADLAAEWFETELLRATLAARGVFGAFAGPWSAGTSTGLLWQSATGWPPARAFVICERRNGRVDRRSCESGPGGRSRDQNWRRRLHELT